MESCLYRREEKLYVEGMEDEDMKKETQNLAYPQAFKLGKIFINFCHWQWSPIKLIEIPNGSNEK